MSIILVAGSIPPKPCDQSPEKGSTPSRDPAKLAEIASKLIDFAKFPSSTPLAICFQKSDSIHFIKNCVLQYSRTLFRNPHNTIALYNRAFLYIQLKEVSKALEDIESILKIDKEHAKAIALKGTIHCEKGEFLKAKACFKLSYIFAKDDPYILLRLSELYNAEQDFKTAEKFANEGLQLVNRLIDEQGEHLFLVSIRAHIHKNFGNLEAAMRDCSTLLKHNPTNKQYLRLKALLFKEMNRHVDAEAIYKHLQKVDPTQWSDYFLLGKLYKIHNKPREAFECFQQAFKFNPNSIEVLFECAYMNIFNSHAEYHYYLNIIEERFPDSCVKLLLNGENAFVNMGKEDLALSLFSEYLRKASSSAFRAQAFYLRAYVYHCKKEFPLAIEDLNKCLEIYPRHYPALYLRGITWHKMCNHYYRPSHSRMNAVGIDFSLNAITDLEKCVAHINTLILASPESRPEPNLNSRFNLLAIAHLTLAKARKSPDTVELSIKILQSILNYPQMDQDSAVLYTFGELLRLNKQYNLALNPLLKASLLAPNLDLPLVALVECYLALKDYGKAKLHVQKLCNLQPNIENYKQLKLRVDQESTAASKPRSSSPTKKKSAKVKVPSGPIIEPQRADPPIFQKEPPSQEYLDKEERIKAEVSKAEERLAAEAAQEAAERKNRSVERKLQEARIRESKTRKLPQSDSKVAKAMPPQEPPPSPKAGSPPSSPEVLKSAKKVVHSSLSTLTSDSSILVPVPMPVEIFRRTIPQNTPSIRAFDPALNVPGVFLKKEKEDVSDVHSRHQSVKPHASKTNQLSFVSDPHLSRIKAAKLALERIELVQLDDLTEIEMQITGMSLLYDFRTLTDSLCPFEGSHFGSDPDFEGIANQTLLATKDMRRLRNDLFHYFPFIQYPDLLEMSKILLTSDLKGRLEIMEREHIWVLKPNEGSNMFSNLELVPADLKVNWKTYVQNGLMRKAVSSQLQFLSDVERICPLTIKILEENMILLRAIRTSYDILTFCLLKIEDPKFQKLKEDLTQATTLPGEIRIVKFAHMYLQSIFGNTGSHE